METMIAYENVSKSYDGTPVVQNFDLTVPQGAFVTIIGSSGSGKTTVLKMVNGLITPDGGRILIKGQDMRQMDLIALRRQIGYAIQGSVLFPHLTVAENIAYVPELLNGRDKAKTKAAVRKWLAKVGLSEALLDRYPSELSGGQQQRVGIARAFVSSPKVIFADEPTGNLDSRTSKQVLYRMLEMSKNSGVTFVMVTHEPDLAECADRIVTILDGKVCSNVVQDEETKKKNRDALFADLEGNLDIGGEAAKEQKAKEQKK